MASVWSVEFADGSTVEVQTTVGDVVAFEKAHDHPINTKMLGDVVWLVWRAASRLGQTGDEFQVWADQVLDFDPVSTATPLVPPVPPS